MNKVNLTDYLYDLPDNRIALFPLEKRDQSKLLFYNKGEITHHTFHHLPDLLPENSILFFNNTKVIPARLHFQKETGAIIEVFLLTPSGPSTVLSEVMYSTNSCTWTCTIGNLKRWSDGLILEKKSDNMLLKAELINRERGIVKFTWNPSCSFAEVITNAGETPLPPYLHRQAVASDKERYQTIYSRLDGAVAAPTAGLHFSEAVLQKIKEKNIDTEFLTLHVSAGTFQPIKTQNAAEHVMHEEQVIINRKLIERLINENRSVIAVGTTSMRTLESIYWYGVKLLSQQGDDFMIEQDFPYRAIAEVSTTQALQSVLQHMDNHNLEYLRGNTSIYIMPGYKFRMCQGIITNFHQPGSTLILLIAAFTGMDWKNIYQSALKNEYRFLSYGDSSFIIPK